MAQILFDEIFFTDYLILQKMSIIFYFTN